MVSAITIGVIDRNKDSPHKSAYTMQAIIDATEHTTATQLNPASCGNARIILIGKSQSIIIVLFVFSIFNWYC